MTYKKKLIEVALPLDAINVASAKEKSIRHGHPSTLHLWWARRPLAAARAVLFASLVDDPSSLPERFPSKKAQDKERERLFRLIEKMVLWENSNNTDVLKEVRAEIVKSTDGTPPSVLDPFAGGGTIPLEAQRLGLQSYASDLNPVAVMINKALIEIPPRFANVSPVRPTIKLEDKLSTWSGAKGLAEDVRYYSEWIRDEARQRIGHLYPQVTLPQEYGGGKATVIAWLWARTVKCPNPACGEMMPLLTTYLLCSKKGKEVYLIPNVKSGGVTFETSTTPPTGVLNVKNGQKRGMSGVFECIFCKTSTTRDYVAEEGIQKRLGVMPTATVAKSDQGRVYLPPSVGHVVETGIQVDISGLEAELSPNPRDVWCRNFGLNTPADLFTGRQLVTLTTLSDLIKDAREKVEAAAVAAGLPEDGVHLRDGGEGALAYSEAVSVFLGFGVDKVADYNSTLVIWSASRNQAKTTFGRQALPMTWDFAEVNTFGGFAGDFPVSVAGIAKSLEALPSFETVDGQSVQRDATQKYDHRGLLISTDPPYYDNIGYADLSDFFYVWMRRSIGEIYPDVMSTMLVPKSTELVATTYRFDGGKSEAKEFFETGLGKAFVRMREAQHLDYPFTVYYAFKQSETVTNDDDETATSSTGWETMLRGLLEAGFSVVGTWPMRTERSARTISIGTNALASSIVLVCRPRPVDAPLTTRKDFLAALRDELPAALGALQQGNIAPVDLAQASIGPGMAVYSRYSKIVEADGSPMSIRTALALINQMLEEHLKEQEGEFDSDTLWALAWYEEYGHESGQYGSAETLSKAKNTSVDGLIQAGILENLKGKVRLLRRDELAEGWDPLTDERLPVWELSQYLIRYLLDDGEAAAAEILRKVGGRGEDAKDLAYRLYALCEKKSWTQEATAYNSLVVAWPELQRLAAESTGPGTQEILI